jgi:DtxR family manganese transport transcriptional regulator
MPTKRTSPARTRKPKAAVPRDPSQQADDHRRTRLARRNELMEDYVEVIADLIDAGGEARVVDIAQRLGVSHVTVTRTIERLAREELVTTKPYRSIFLTDKGKAIALRVRHRHEVVLRFLLAMGVDEATARVDAEGIEHHVSERTLAAFERYCRDKR